MIILGEMSTEGGDPVDSETDGPLSIVPFGFPSAVISGSDDDEDNLRTVASEESGEPRIAHDETRESAPPSLPTKEYFCGIGRWHPKWLQVFRNEKFFTVILCLNCLIEGALATGSISVVLSSIERRYHFSSTVAGVIASSFDVAVFLSVLFISYFAGKGHKPRWLGASLIVMGIGAFVFALPQFILGSYNVGRDAKLRYEQCSDDQDFSPECKGSDVAAIFFFIVGQLLIGFGSAPLFTVGTAYLDEIVHPNHVAIHFGIFFGLAVIGPAIGFVFGGVFLLLYVDPWESTTLEPTDPGWVGAWWLPFVFSGIASIALSVPFFLFPRHLPNSHFVKQARQKEMAKVYESKHGHKEDSHFATKVKALPTHIRSLCTNPAWVLVTTSITFTLLIVSGMGAFMPKYWESQFRLTSSTASLIAGAIGVAPGGIGALTGGLIVHFSKAKGRRAAMISWIATLLVLFSVFSFSINCPTTNIVGVSEEYPDGSKNKYLDSSCTLPCNCTSTVYEPVCGLDEFTYFSPCRAGCQKIPETEIFENCTCIAQQQVVDLGFNISNTSLVDVFLFNSTANDGPCSVDCRLKMGLFAVLSATMVLFAFIQTVPNVMVTVRCVADEQRTFALGFQSVFVRLLGFIPGPIIFGVIFDSTCIFWQEECGGRGSCWVYDNTNLSFGALGAALIGIFLKFVFMFLCWLVYPRKKKEVTKTDSFNQSLKMNDISGSDQNGATNSQDKIPMNKVESTSELLSSVDKSKM